MRRLLFLLALCACAHVPQDQTVCPESRDVRCLTRTTCAMDAARGCRVCQCEAAAAEGPDGKPQLPPATDRR
jgi:hypothetical protein